MYNILVKPRLPSFTERDVLILHDCSHRCAGIIYSYKNETYIGGYTVVLVLVELSGFQAKKRHTLCDLHCTTTVAVALVELSGLGG